MVVRKLDDQAIFEVARKIGSPEARQAYLLQVCGEDLAVSKRIEALLHAHDESESFLESPPPGLGNLQTINQPLVELLGTQIGPYKLLQQIGPYKLLQQIGEGGMGTVFMAEQKEPVQRRVALKVIKPGMDSHQIIARFEAERQALAMMDHVNIARVLDAGATESGRPYFVMELVHGVPITTYCDDNHLTPRERLELFVPVCQAIQHAHQKGIIHRDVKPSNVMITLYDGKPVPKVIDFGVAKAMEQKLTERTLFTQYGTMIGTLEYMSPEQAEMSDLGVDTRSDIYSLGVLLYELLTGSTPLGCKQMKEAAYTEILRMIKDEDPPKPSTRLSESGEALASISAQRHTEPAKLSKLMRGELDWIVMKTLEKDRNRRYATANGLAADVQRYLNDEPVQACPPSSAYRFRKFARRNKRVLATVGLLAFALVAGTVVSAWQAIRATKAEGLANTNYETSEVQRHKAQDQLLLTEQAQNQATRRLFEARLAQAKAGSLSRRVGQRHDSLDAVVEAAKIARDLNLPEERLLELRNAAIACLALPDLHLAKQWPGWPVGSDNVDFDGKLEQYARSDSQGSVSICRVADNEEVARLPPTGAQTWIRFSRDGKFLAVGSSGGHLTLWKLGGPEPIREKQFDDAFGFDFSSDSRRCAIGRVDGPIRLVDLASEQLSRELPKGRRGMQLALHPDGRQLAVSCDTSVEIRELDTGKVVADLKHPLKAHNLAWHPDGQTLAVGGSDRRIYLWDVAASKQTLVLEGARNDAMEFAYNPAGDLLASACWEGVLRLWDPRTGKQLFSTWSGISNMPPRFGPDGGRLAGDIRDGKLGLWDVIATGEYRTLVRAQAGGKGLHHNAAIRSDARLLAVGMYGGVGLWDLASRRELSFIELPGSNLVLFETSGELLTNGSAGLLRWPIQTDAATPGVRRIGPPQKLSVPGSTCKIDSSFDSRVLASAQFQGGLVLHADRPDQPVRLQPHHDVRYIAVSPKGEWVATGSHSAAGVKIWEALNLSGKPVKEIPGDGSCVGFSPDGKWLATTEGGLRLWAVGSWQEGAQIGGGGAFAFSPDGKLLAVDTGYGAVRLVDPDTGREYARLEDPNQDRASAMSFTTDGTQLVTTNNDGHSVHVWDLRLIRKQLTKMGLDWDLLAYPPPGPNDGKPLRLDVDLGEWGAVMAAQVHGQRAVGWVQSGEWKKAIGAYSQAIELDPKNAQAHNNLAWWLATCPDATLRDPGRALDSAQKAVELAPNEGNYWNTLGAAHYRAEEWSAAIDCLNKSGELRTGGDSFDWFFLAMAHWQLGNQEEAYKWQDQAVQWMGKNKPQDQELLRFRAEAASLLEVKEKK